MKSWMWIKWVDNVRSRWKSSLQKTSTHPFIQLTQFTLSQRTWSCDSGSLVFFVKYCLQFSGIPGVFVSLLFDVQVFDSLACFSRDSFCSVNCITGLWLLFVFWLSDWHLVYDNSNLFAWILDRTLFLDSYLFVLPPCACQNKLLSAIWVYPGLSMKDRYFGSLWTERIWVTIDLQCLSATLGSFC